jgi:hypothetical protein
MHQDVYIGRNINLPGTTAQNAFWEFATDPNNPILQRLTDQAHKNVSRELAAA